MVMLYDEYSSKSFKTAVEKYLGSQFVQPLAAQIGDNVSESSYKIMKPTMDKQIVQMPSGQFPNILFLTTLSNHYDILCRCKSFEERLFPNDEPASVLLERIRVEKERLIKEGKIKKGKKSAKTSDKPHYPFGSSNG